MAGINTSPRRAGPERVDALDKVRGATRYAADQMPAGLLHAALVPAAIGRGRIERIDTAAAERVPGVRLVLSHVNIGPLPSGGFILGGGFGFQSLQPLAGPDIAYRGQYVALVVADTLEAAREAAQRVEVAFTAMPAAPVPRSPGAETAAQPSLIPLPPLADKHVGDADAVFAQAAVKVDVTARLPAQHQNPMELVATVAEWQGEQLVVHEPTQNAEAVRHGLARQLGMPAAQVRVVSPAVGGGFGQKNSLQSHTVLVAIAARRLGRPVKLVVPRALVFHNTSFRPHSVQRVRLGASRDGRVLAAIHETDQQTSRHDAFPSTGSDTTARLYDIRHFRSADRLVRTDVQTPGFMRGPHEHPAVFAFELAMDELAQATGLDPVELRLRNDGTTDPVTGKPYSSRHVAACLRRGAELMRWERRRPSPRSMSLPDGTLVGLGVATGAYKAAAAPARATVRLASSGRLWVAVGGHEMGQGLRTAIAESVSRITGAPLAAIEVQLGDTAFAPQHLTAGSWGTATALPAVEEACRRLMDELQAPAGAAQPGHLLDRLKASGREQLEVRSQTRAPGQPEQVFGRLDGGLPAAGGPVYPEFVSFSHAAHFVEVHVEPTTRRVRVARCASVIDCGRVVSRRTARSQAEGGVVWGIGAALREVSEVDPRHGGFLNADLAEYVIPVAADIGRIDVDFIDEPDPRLNPQGVKGLGEIVMVGVAAAVANAVFHATGQRLHHLPIRLEDLY
ncbi:xanthine dehydrogenase family protein molybdopterin-binding subunit [Aquincola tertiaricarbonis]|uniref:xanthine dehydrogenase family protein molybdopterin-binding subunit n=1 Tax=Aquincola tertiaricarbonis TaxID=391953 RepID=UPI000614C019|nr:xanthine dehydrogenase family protein molybdopterin-binding subunit [Aquincola tertiaricarbonis]